MKAIWFTLFLLALSANVYGQEEKDKNKTALTETVETAESEAERQEAVKQEAAALRKA